jgi:sugar phosphate isomerase/epimerase
MLPLRIAVATHCFEQPLKASLQTAREVGAQGVVCDARRELMPADLSATGRRQLLHYLDELGLSVAALTFPTRRALFDLDRLDARLQALREAMQLASQLNCRMLTARLGRPPGPDQADARSVMMGVLNDIARYGNHMGVTVALTPAREQPDALMEILAAVTQGPMMIDFDPVAFLAAGCDPGEVYRALHTVVGHVRVRDAVRESGAGVLEVPVGRGEVEWDSLLALVDESHYRGWLTADRTEGTDRRTDVARAIEYLRRLALG